MSNCVVGSGGSRLPCSTIAEHSVEGCDHFSHDGDDDGAKPCTASTRWGWSPRDSIDRGSQRRELVRYGRDAARFSVHCHPCKAHVLVGRSEHLTPSRLFRRRVDKSTLVRRCYELVVISRQRKHSTSMCHRRYLPA